MLRPFPALALACLLLTACGKDNTAGNAQQGEDALPVPGAVNGSVTGMPNPGVATRQPRAEAAPTEVEIAQDETVADEASTEATATLPAVVDGAPVPDAPTENGLDANSNPVSDGHEPAPPVEPPPTQP